jgi:hypothetical protein
MHGSGRKDQKEKAKQILNWAAGLTGLAGAMLGLASVFLKH